MAARARFAGRFMGSLLLNSVLALVGNAYAGALQNTDWPAYNNTANGQRYSPLAQITAENVIRLKEVCRLKIDDSGTFQAGLVEIGGVIYLTNSHDTLAVDATTCAAQWRHEYQPEQEDVFQINRGVAVANGKLFRGTPDGRLLAIDASSGKTRWQEQIGDPMQGEFFSSVPAVWQGSLILGAAGSDWGIRGRIMAFDQDTGRELWRFYTIPRDQETGADTWANRKSARYGGGGTWSTYTLDMAAGEVFVPVGNPAPDFVPSHRPGQNLFTNSVVVLNARTGALKWWHQMAPNDGLDLDVGAAPMLYWNSKGDPMVAIGSKDGYVYSVNRETHRRAFATAVTTIRKPTHAPDAAGVHSCPGPVGGVEWNGPAYDHKTQQIVIGAVDWCALIKSGNVDFRPGQLLIGGMWVWDEQRSGWVSALDPDSGKVRWQYHADAPVVAGVTPTAGGVTFTGDMAGNLLALDSRDGKLLLKTATGGALAGGVISYARGGRQYVAITSGNVSRLSFGENGKPSLVIYALAENTAAVASAAPLASNDVPTTAPPAQLLGDAARGGDIYQKNCAACHGGHGEGAVGPALSGLHVRRSLAAIVEWIVKPSNKMPQLYPATLNAQAVADVAAFAHGL
jgi:alcohol dehydrogenase (cytochrome c)